MFNKKDDDGFKVVQVQIFALAIKMGLSPREFLDLTGSAEALDKIDKFVVDCNELMAETKDLREKNKNG